jgi:hypothetical protein
MAASLSDPTRRGAAPRRRSEAHARRLRARDLPGPAPGRRRRCLHPQGRPAGASRRRHGADGRSRRLTSGGRSHESYDADRGVCSVSGSQSSNCFRCRPARTRPLCAMLRTAARSDSARKDHTAATRGTSRGDAMPHQPEVVDRNRSHCRGQRLVVAQERESARPQIERRKEAHPEARLGRDEL